MLLTWTSLVSIVGLTNAAVLPRDQITTKVDGGGRNWQSAVQNINGMNSILTLLPVLTGKVQNIKLIASRSFPASFVVAGIGAGRVLSKLQLGILLWSFELYRNTVAELSYAHDEYVNKFMPKLRHVPSGTAERHTTSLIINHNPAEAYMVEAWFQARGCPSTVKLKQNNYTRLLVGSVIYLAIYSAETFLAVQNGADGTARLLTCVQAVCVCLWLAAVIMVQVARGQGNKADMHLNRTGSPEYRCLQIPTAGNHVTCEVLSFHLDNLSAFQMYGARYEQPVLRIAGGLILVSGVLDVVSTVLIVGLTAWAYPWIGIEVVIILTKVIFCLEPTREIEIANVAVDDGHTTAGQNPNMNTNPNIHTNMNTNTNTNTTNQNQNQNQNSNHLQPGQNQYQHQYLHLLPLKIELGDDLVCKQVTTDHNIVHDPRAALEWRSTTAGLWIGQAYVSTAMASSSSSSSSSGVVSPHGTTVVSSSSGATLVSSPTSSTSTTKYLVLNHEKKLTLVTAEPEKQDNQALQREFMAALATVVEANVVPSTTFIAAVERTLTNIKCTMVTHWFLFGSKDVMDKLAKARRDQLWRHYL